MAALEGWSRRHLFIGTNHHLAVTLCTHPPWSRNIIHLRGRVLSCPLYGGSSTAVQQHSSCTGTSGSIEGMIDDWASSSLQEHCYIIMKPCRVQTTVARRRRDYFCYRVYTVYTWWEHDCKCVLALANCLRMYVCFVRYFICFLVSLVILSFNASGLLLLITIALIMALIIALIIALIMAFVCRTCRTQYDGTSLHCLLCLLHYDE